MTRILPQRQLAARPYLAAGVALVGATTIAVSPVAPPMPDIAEVASASRAVQLSALANPFEPVFQQALQDIEDLVAAVASNPAPILQQVIANQLDALQVLGGLGQDYLQNFVHFVTGTGAGTLQGQLQNARESFQEGDYGLAFGFLAAIPILALTAGDVFGMLDDVIPQLTEVLQRPFESIAAAIGAIGNPQNILPVALGLVQVTTGTAQAFGEGLEDVAAAMQTGDPTAVLNAVLEGSANTLGALLTGVLASDPVSAFGNGILGGVLYLRDAIAEAIAPPTPPAAAEVTSSTAVNEMPSAKATVVTLSTTADAEETAPAEARTAAATPEDDATEAAAAVESEGAPAAEAAVTDEETADPDATQAADDAAASGGTGVVRESPKAEPAETGTLGGGSTETASGDGESPVGSTGSSSDADPGDSSDSSDGGSSDSE